MTPVETKRFISQEVVGENPFPNRLPANRQHDILLI